MTERTIHLTRGVRVFEDEHGLSVAVTLHNSGSCEYTDSASRAQLAEAVALLHKHAARFRARADELEDVAARLVREGAKVAR